MKLSVAVLLAAAGPLFAQAPVHMFVSNGMKAVVDGMQAQCERAVGRPLAMEIGTSVGLKKKIEAGEPFEATILTADLVDDLIKEGKLVASSRASLARAGIGIGIRKGAARPDIRTAAALKQALLNAKAVSWAADGASRVHIEKMLETLGIAQQMKPKIILESGSAKSAERVARGDADFIITLISEILPAPGVELLGPLPMEFQNYVNFAAGVSAKASDSKAGQAAVKCFASPAAMATLKAKGMEPLK